MTQRLLRLVLCLTAIAAGVLVVLIPMSTLAPPARARERDLRRSPPSQPLIDGRLIFRLEKKVRETQPPRSRFADGEMADLVEFLRSRGGGK